MILLKGKKKSLFIKIYLSAIAVFAVLLIAASVVLYSFLDSYEKTRPSYVADSVFKEYFLSSNVAELVLRYSPDEAVFNDNDSINTAFKEHYDTSLLQCISVSSNETSENYAVSYNDRRIAAFTLSKGEETVKYGLKKYVLSDAEFYFDKSEPMTFLLPKGNTLSINGIAVGDGYIIESDIEDVSCKYMPDGVTGIVYDKYVIPSVLFSAEAEVIDVNGKSVAAAFDESQELYTVPLTYSEELRREHSAYVINAVSEYTKYLSNDATFSNVAPYLDPSSEIYKRLRSVLVQWVRDHSSYSIFDQTATEFYEYSDDVFSCHVTLKERLTRDRYADYIENVDVTLYLKRSGGRYLIYEIVNN